MVGTSDGTSCAEAREQYVEEIDMQGGGSPDLTASDLGSVLNNGAYMLPCDVPETSQVQICAAVKGGMAVGVTVALAPSNPEVERCVAKQVRGLSFPSHSRMDIAVVRFSCSLCADTDYTPRH
jgi:eukaryotic-like serine/threonine-protein kinase